jgi:hypothetical protein
LKRLNDRLSRRADTTCRKWYTVLTRDSC